MMEFIRQLLRGVAAGLGIGYNLLTGDLESLNYEVRDGMIQVKEPVDLRSGHELGLYE